MTFEEFKEKVDAIYSKITPDELIAELEELGYPIECFEEEPKEEWHSSGYCVTKPSDYYFRKTFQVEMNHPAIRMVVKDMPSSFDNDSSDCYFPLAA